jgi:hypothetical protein
MSSNSDWSEIQKEGEFDKNGKFVIKKVTLGKNNVEDQWISGIANKDLIENIVKLAGLITIALSALAFYYQIQRDKKADRDKQKADERSKVEQFEARIADQIVSMENFQLNARSLISLSSILKIVKVNLNSISENKVCNFRSSYQQITKLPRNRLEVCLSAMITLIDLQRLNLRAQRSRYYLQVVCQRTILKDERTILLPLLRQP